MDTIWTYILAFISHIQRVMDALISPLNTIHPALSITILAAFTVAVTSVLKKRFTTRRYKRLKEEFESLHSLRQEALKSFEDPSKGKRMARNIDQASLNRVYYDYFFEGLLNNLITTYLPVLCMAAYVNESFQPHALQEMTGQTALLTLPLPNPIQIAALPWFVLCLVGCWLGMWLFKNRRQRSHPESAG
jgi:uncharacterized membrane protein (DUF106 family)